MKKKENLTIKGSETRNTEIESKVKTMKEEAEVLDITIGTTSTIMNADSHHDGYKIIITV